MIDWYCMVFVLEWWYDGKVFMYMYGMGVLGWGRENNKGKYGGGCNIWGK